MPSDARLSPRLFARRSFYVALGWRRTVAGEALGASAERGAPRHVDARARDVRAAQTRLLFSNAPTAVAINIISASLLSYCQWELRPAPHRAGVAGVHDARLGRSPHPDLALLDRLAATRDAPWWGRAFSLGAGAAGAGWGAAGVLLYPEVPLVN